MLLEGADQCGLLLLHFTVTMHYLLQLCGTIAYSHSSVQQIIDVACVSLLGAGWQDAHTYNYSPCPLGQLSTSDTCLLTECLSCRHYSLMLSVSDLVGKGREHKL